MRAFDVSKITEAQIRDLIMADPRIQATNWRRPSVRVWEFPEDDARVTLFAESPTQWQATLSVLAQGDRIERRGETPEQALAALPVKAIVARALNDLEWASGVREDMDDLWEPER